MTLFLSDYLLENGLAAIAESDQAIACDGQPTTYYEAVDASAWQVSTAYSLGDVVRPTTRNGYVYEVTTAGSTSASEPTWPTTPGNTVVDGGVTFTCRANNALYSSAMIPGDFTIDEGGTSGRKVTSANKAAISVHTSGTVNHQAFVDTVNKRLLLVVTANPNLPVTGGSSTANIAPAVWESRDGQAA